MPNHREAVKPGRIRAACLIALSLGTVAARAATITISDVTFNPTWATTTGTVTGGGYDTDQGVGLFSGVSPDWGTSTTPRLDGDSLGTYFQVPRFQSGYDPNTPVMGPAGSGVTLGWDTRFPETSNNPRDIIQLTWGSGNGLADAPGEDLAIFEAATSEAFTIRAHEVTVGWSAWYYKPYRQSDPRPQSAIDNDTTPTLFDLASMNIGGTPVINAIEIANLLITDRVDILVDSLDDYAQVDFGGNGFEPKRFSTSQKDYVTFSETKFDPDIQYVVGLHAPISGVSTTIAALDTGLGLSFPERLAPTGSALPLPGAPLLLLPGLWLLARRRQSPCRASHCSSMTSTQIITP